MPSGGNNQGPPQHSGYNQDGYNPQGNNQNIGQHLMGPGGYNQGPPQHSGYNQGPPQHGAYSRGPPTGQQDYRSMKFEANHHVKTYQFNTGFVMIAIQVFTEFDRDRSGTIEMFEFPPLITALFSKLGLPPPNFQDMYHLMQKYDADKNGVIDRGEYLKMVNEFAGSGQGQQGFGGGRH
jgi:hypothetical protein